MELHGFCTADGRSTDGRRGWRAYDREAEARRRCRVGVVGGSALVIEQLNRSESRATSLTVTSHCARLLGRTAQQRVMVTALLVIVACVATGMILHYHQHE